MLKLGIIGYPLSHTLSPVMHKAALAKLGIDGDYQVLETKPEELSQRFEYLKSNEFSGINVTIPYKLDVMKFLDEIDSDAKFVGAVNTVKFSEGKLIGYNTDVYGFINAFSEYQRQFLKGKNVAVAGAGGAAKAVMAGLEKLEVSKIVIYARNVQKSKEFVSSLNCGLDISVQEIHDDADLSDYSLVVNTTPLGMKGENEGLSPFSENSINTLKNTSLVYDIVYKPSLTKLLEYAKKCDITAINGVDMLVLQGAKALEIWTGKTSPVEIMRKEVIRKLNND